MIKQNKNIKDILCCGSASLRYCIKKPFFIFAFVILFSLGAFAQSNSEKLNETTVMPANFESDGCSHFPDGDYFDCCFEHDKAYYFGGSWAQRWRADKKLYKCVAAKEGFKHKLIAPVMWTGVRVFGVPFLPTSFRWGFGKNKREVDKNKQVKTKKERKKTSKNFNQKKPGSDF